MAADCRNTRAGQRLRRGGRFQCPDVVRTWSNQILRAFWLAESSWISKTATIRCCCELMRVQRYACSWASMVLLQNSGPQAVTLHTLVHNFKRR